MGVTTMPAHAGYGGDEHRFVVDAEHGFVVRRTALVDGEPWAVTELIQLVVDEPIDPGLFRCRRHDRADPGRGEGPHAPRRRGRPGCRRSGGRRRRVASRGRGPPARSARRRATGRARPPLRAVGPAARRRSRGRGRHPRCARDYAEASADGRDLVNVQAGEGLGREPFGWRAGGHRERRRATPPSPWTLRFVCPDEAVVWFSLEIGGERSPLVRERRGRAVRVGGRWLIERGTIAELLAFAGARRRRSARGAGPGAAAATGPATRACGPTSRGSTGRETGGRRPRRRPPP